jgi:hypothetical protein
MQPDDMSSGFPMNPDATRIFNTVRGSIIEDLACKMAEVLDERQITPHEKIAIASRLWAVTASGCPDPHAAFQAGMELIRADFGRALQGQAERRARK